MDIMRPQLVQIGSICYRKNPVHKNPFGVNEDEEESDERFVMRKLEEEDDYANEYANDHLGEESCMAGGTHVEKTSTGFRASLSVPNQLFGKIIGMKGETKKRMETETKTKISIPRQGSSGDIVVEGATHSGVLSACSRIQVLAESARARHPFTHFVSFPITSDTIKASFEDFKKDVLEICNPGDGIDASIFQNPDKLHLTVGTLTLLDANEVLTASQLLSNSRQLIVDDILQGHPLEVEVQGLEYMNDDPDDVDVLYAQVTPLDRSQILQKLADRLVDIFTSARLMRREYDRVKLHVTVMNSLMRKESAPEGAEGSAPGGAGSWSGGGQARDKRGEGRRAERESFHASRILEHLGDYSFGTHLISSVQISQRYFTGTDGYYASAGNIQLPEPEQPDTWGTD